MAPLGLRLAQYCSVYLLAKNFIYQSADDERGREDGGRKQDLALSSLETIVRWAVAAWHR